MRIKTFASVLLVFLFILILKFPKFEITSPDLSTSESLSPETKKPLTVVLSFDYEDMDTNIGEKNLPEIFRILDKHNASATFFVLGVTAKRKPDSILEIYERGYSLGMHTYYHNFTIFNQEDAMIIAEVYNTNIDYVWAHSFKTQSAFYSDLKTTQLEIMKALNNATTPRIFRSPSLIVNWTKDKRYFDSLKDAGIEIDSSIYQDFSNPRPYYFEEGVIEVPVTTSELRFNMPEVLYNLSENYMRQNIPLVLYIHPQKLNETTLDILDEYLTNIDQNYDVRYVKVEDVPKIFNTSKIG